MRRTDAVTIARQVRDGRARRSKSKTLLDRRPAQLSGGQRQRVALGRAIVRKANAFLLDEPLSNLDPSLRAQARAELRRLHRQLGTTVVYVTHDQEEAMTLGGRIAVMRDGALEQVAPPLEVYARPANTFVARFIGAPAMNLLPAAVAGIEAPDGRGRRHPPAGRASWYGRSAGARPWTSSSRAGPITCSTCAWTGRARRFWPSSAAPRRPPSAPTSLSRCRPTGCTFSTSGTEAG